MAKMPRVSAPAVPGPPGVKTKNRWNDPAHPTFARLSRLRQCRGARRFAVADHGHFNLYAAPRMDVMRSVPISLRGVRMETSTTLEAGPRSINSGTNRMARLWEP